MKRIITIKSPTGQTIEVYKSKCVYCGRSEICGGSYPEGCFLENDLLKLGDKWIKLSNITEEQAKELGFEVKYLFDDEEVIKFTPKDVLTIEIMSQIKVTEADLSNILLILIEP